MFVPINIEPVNFYSVLPLLRDLYMNYLYADDAVRFMAATKKLLVNCIADCSIIHICIYIWIKRKQVFTKILNTEPFEIF